MFLRVWRGLFVRLAYAMRRRRLFAGFFERNIVLRLCNSNSRHFEEAVEVEIEAMLAIKRITEHPIAARIFGVGLLDEQNAAVCAIRLQILNNSILYSD